MPGIGAGAGSGNALARRARWRTRSGAPPIRFSSSADPQPGQTGGAPPGRTIASKSRSHARQAKSKRGTGGGAQLPPVMTEIWVSGSSTSGTP